MTDTAPTITVYSKPACVQCHATTKGLDKAGLAYDVVDINVDDAARESQCVCQAATADRGTMVGGSAVCSRPSRMRAQITSTCLRARARRA